MAFIVGFIFGGFLGMVIMAFLSICKEDKR